MDKIQNLKEAIEGLEILANCVKDGYSQQVYDRVIGELEFDTAEKALEWLSQFQNKPSSNPE